MKVTFNYCLWDAFGIFFSAYPNDQKMFLKLVFVQIKEAEGGILFVDKAYRLISMQKADDKDYGLEALEEIMSVMDTGKIVVIFAGYSEPMKLVIASNEGFCRRVTKFERVEERSLSSVDED